MFSQLRWVRPCIIVCFCLFSANFAQAVSLSKIKAPWLTILPAGQFESKPQKRGPLSLILNSIPQGKLPNAIPPECSAIVLEKLMLQAKNLQGQAFSVQNFLSACEGKLNRYPPSKIMALLKMAEGKYPLEGYKNLNEIILKLPYKVTIHGLIAVKDLERPRPLLIMICGSACDLSHAVAREFLTEFFDAQPFNILIVPSLSGSDFIHDNFGFGMGGFEEGRQAFEIIRLLGGEDSPFRKIISSFHVVGTSLGGNGSLFSSVYGTFNNHLLSGPKLQSVSALCPVVDLKASLLDLDRDDIVGRHFTGLITDTVLKNFALVLGANHDMPTLYKPGHNQSVPFVEKYVYPRYKELSKRVEFPLAPFSQFDLDTPEAFWRANDFINYYPGVRIPTLAIYSEDDFVVSPRSNSEALNKALEKNNNPNVNVLRVLKGSHCAADEIYGEDIIGGIIKNFVLSQSPEFDFASGHQALDIRKVDGAQSLVLNDKDEKFFGYNWSTKKDSSTVTVTFKIWEPHIKDTEVTTCSRWNPYYAGLGCFDIIKLNIPLNKFFPEMGSEKISSSAQAEQLTRWFNSRVRILTEKGYEPVDTVEAPSIIDWTRD